MVKMKCPYCGASGKFYTTAKCFAEVNGATGYVERHEGLTWGSDAPCTCGECYYEGVYSEFAVLKEVEDGDA